MATKTRKAAKTRKQQIAQDTADDAFMEGGSDAVEWIEKNGRNLLIGVVVVLIVVGAGLFMKSSAARSASVVTTSLTDAVDSYREATDPSTVFTSTIPAKLKETFEKARPDFDKIITGNPKDGAGKLALLYAGDLARRVGDHAKAETHFRAYLSQAKGDDVMRFFAIEGVGYALEEQGKHDDALGFFEQLTKLPNDFYKDYGYKHVARVHELKGDKAKAVAAYKAIMDELPDSKLRDFADERISALE